MVFFRIWDWDVIGFNNLYLILFLQGLSIQFKTLTGCSMPDRLLCGGVEKTADMPSVSGVYLGFLDLIQGARGSGFYKVSRLQRFPCYSRKTPHFLGAITPQLHTISPYPHQ